MFSTKRLMARITMIMIMIIRILPVFVVMIILIAINTILGAPEGRLSQDFIASSVTNDGSGTWATNLLVEFPQVSKAIRKSQNKTGLRGQNEKACLVDVCSFECLCLTCRLIHVRIVSFAFFFAAEFHKEERLSMGGTGAKHKRGPPRLEPSYQQT